MTDNRLKKLYEKAGMSRAAVADFCRVGERTVERWEKGETSIPDGQKRRLCSRFSVTSDHLMGWDREPAESRSAAA